jgi:lysozyme
MNTWYHDVVDAENYVRSRLASGELTYTQIARLARAFQLQNSLDADGKPGPDTLRRVCEVLDQADQQSIPIELPNLALDPKEWLYGIDIDHHQEINEFDELDRDLVRFAYVGVSEGTSGRASEDTKFRRHLTELLESGVRWLGVYHFARPSSARLHGPGFGQPLGEVENFARQWEAADKITGRLLPPVLDMEDEKEKLSSEELVRWTLEWCEHCERLIGRSPIIYTYFSFIHSQLKGYDGTLNKYPLWLADYRGAPPSKPRDIPNWPWLIWQFTGTGKVPGIIGACDQNVFRGTSAQLGGLLL